MTSNQSPPTPAWAGGQVAAGDLDGDCSGSRCGSRLRCRVRPWFVPGVAAGVVQRDGGAGGELLGEQQVVWFERFGAAAPGEDRDAKGDPPGAQRTTITEWSRYARIGGRPGAGCLRSPS